MNMSGVNIGSDVNGFQLNSLQCTDSVGVYGIALKENI